MVLDQEMLGRLLEVLEAGDHVVSLADWALLLLAHNRLEYAVRPLADAGESMVTTAERIAVMTLRHERGRALFHPDDVLVALALAPKKLIRFSDTEDASPYWPGRCRPLDLQPAKIGR